MRRAMCLRIVMASVAWLGVLVASSFAAEQQGSVGETATQIKPQVSEAIRHAREAEEAGKKGRPEVLVKHAEMALDNAKEAQRAGHNELLNDGVFSLGEAIEHGKKGDVKDATEHVMHAMMKLSQAAGMQMPEHGHAGATPGTGRETAAGETVVKGEVLKVERDNFFVVKDASGQEVHLFLGADLKPGWNVGDRIEAKVDREGHVTSYKRLGP